MHIIIGEKPQLTRKMVASMFYTGELEDEIRDASHPERMTWAFKYNSDREKYMQQVSLEHTNKIYPHTPTQTCPQRGTL